jgi:hypothetical protein
MFDNHDNEIFNKFETILKVKNKKNIMDLLLNLIID